MGKNGTSIRSAVEAVEESMVHDTFVKAQKLYDQRLAAVKVLVLADCLKLA